MPVVFGRSGLMLPVTCHDYRFGRPTICGGGFFFIGSIGICNVLRKLTIANWSAFGSASN